MEGLANSRQVAEYLGVQEQTLRLWAHQKKGPDYIKVGSTRRYEWSDVRAWLDERKVNH